MVMVPKRLEDAIGKTKSQNVLRSLFTQEMVYTVNLMLLEYGSIGYGSVHGQIANHNRKASDDDTRREDGSGGQS